MSIYLHTLPKSKIVKLMHSHMTYGEFVKQYKQPDWCMYPEALEGSLGCWSLIGGYVHSETFCLTCDCYRKEKAND
jgi:hypothetical protein